LEIGRWSSGNGLVRRRQMEYSTIISYVVTLDQPWPKSRARSANLPKVLLAQHRCFSLWAQFHFGRKKMILSGILIGRFFDLEFLFSGETIVYFGERKDLRSISTHGSSLKTTARRYTAAVGAQSSDRPSRVGMSKPVSCAVAGSLPVPNAINSPPAQTLLRSLFRKEVNKWFRMSTREITRDVCIVWLAVNG